MEGIGELLHLRLQFATIAVSTNYLRNSHAYERGLRFIFGQPPRSPTSCFQR